MEITREELEALENLLHYLRAYKKGSDYQVLERLIKEAKIKN
jgi:hypothetical protein